LRGVRGRRPRGSAQADRGRLLRRAVSVEGDGRGGRRAQDVRPAREHGGQLLRDRHRRLPLRRVRGRVRHVRHRAGGRLRQAEGRKARIISWPFGLYDCAAQSDGAAAAIITRRELAKRFRDDHVLVRAVAIALAPDPKEDPDFDFLRWKPTVYAARQAYEQAGIRDPRKDIDLAQVHDCFTLTELLAYEDLGFCDKGAAKEHIKSGTFELV